MSFVETGRKVIETIKNGLWSSSYSYQDIAYDFYGRAREEWNIALFSRNPWQSYEIQFKPYRFDLPGFSPIQIAQIATREIYIVFQELFPPSDEAYLCQGLDRRVAYYMSNNKGEINGDYRTDIVGEAARQVDRYKVGISEQGEQARVIISPPGSSLCLPNYNEVTKIEVAVIDEHLPRDPNFQTRRFRLVQSAGLLDRLRSGRDNSYWEAVAA